MITIKFDQQFQIDFKRISRRIPQIVTELEYVIEAIEEYGRVPESYNPHMLDRPRGIYSGYAEFHLAEGKMDVLVIYSERSDDMAGGQQLLVEDIPRVGQQGRHARASASFSHAAVTNSLIEKLATKCHIPAKPAEPAISERSVDSLMERLNLIKQHI